VIKMQDILYFFNEILQIEHCSFKTTKLKEYILQKSKEFGYLQKCDDAGNILVFKEDSKICFQAHYDMVCVEDAPKIEPIIDNNIMKAKNSSLGADNGIAVAMMLKMMQNGVDAEFLFTNDEEVGLIGAKELNLDIKSKYLLNLDSEDEASVFIGCAGGVDLKAKKSLKETEANEEFYEVEIINLPGGHSGVDIDKNIPNAIFLLLNILKESNAKISKLKGGVASNAIPANAKAIVSTSNIKEHKNLTIKKLDKKYKVYEFDYDEILNSKNGVLSYNSNFNVVQNSLNLGLIKLEDGNLELDISMRSMDNSELNTLAKEIKSYWSSLNYATELLDKYPAWKPEVNEFTAKVKKALEEVFGSSKELVIHAGLECGILSQKFPNVKLASIGPDIRFPHSVNEEVDLKSVERTYKVVEQLIKEL
jgi:dipeptidase D